MPSLGSRRGCRLDRISAALKPPLVPLDVPVASQVVGVPAADGRSGSSGVRVDRPSGRREDLDARRGAGWGRPPGSDLGCLMPVGSTGLLVAGVGARLRARPTGVRACEWIARPGGGRLEARRARRFDEVVAWIGDLGRPPVPLGCRLVFRSSSAWMPVAAFSVRGGVVAGGGSSRGRGGAGRLFGGRPRVVSPSSFVVGLGVVVRRVVRRIAVDRGSGRRQPAGRRRATGFAPPVGSTGIRRSRRAAGGDPGGRGLPSGSTGFRRRRGRGRPWRPWPRR